MSPQRISLPRVNMEQVRPWLPLAGAAVGGLILGLLIGWVFWPVSWTNAQLTDLAPEQKAAYLGAVADAFALDGSQSPETPLKQRLTAFGDATADEIVAAMEYFRAQPDADPVQLANLAKMATVLGVPVDSTMMAAATALQGESQAGATAQDAGGAPGADVTTLDATTGDAAALDAAASPSGSADEGGAGILTWLLAVLASLALIGGGVYLLLRISRPRVPSSSMTQPASPVLPGEPRPVQPVMATSPDKAASTRTTAWSPDKPQQSQTVAPPAPVNDLEFDDEVEDDPASRYQRSTGTVIPVDDDEPVTPRYLGQVSTLPIDQVEQHAAALEATSTANGMNTTVAVATVEAPAPVIVATLPKVGYTDAVPSVATAEVATAVVATQSTRTSPRPPARKFVAKYTCEYFTGAPDYIEAHNILDPITSKYIGECGMSVSSKNRSLHANPDQVIALEVWMYDKLDPKDNVNNTRVLLSDYAAAHDLAQSFARDRDVSKVVLVKPGTKFQVDGRNMVLEGEIVSVEYDREGVFRDVKLAMSILSRK